MSEHTPLTEAERIEQAIYDVAVDHPMWIGDDNLPLDYSPVREARIGDFVRKAAHAALAARTSTATADTDELARAIRTLLPGLRVANYVERWSPASPAVTALGILARYVGQEVDEAGELQDPHVPSAHRRRPEGEAATADTGLREVVVSILKRWNCPGCFAPDHPCGKPECVYREELREAILADLLATPASTEDRGDNEGTR